MLGESTQYVNVFYSHPYLEAANVGVWAHINAQLLPNLPKKAQNRAKPVKMSVLNAQKFESQTSTSRLCLSLCILMLYLYAVFGP